MMNDITIQELSEALEGIDPGRFTAQVDRYVRASAEADRALSGPEQLAEKKLARYEACYADVIKEASHIVSQSALAANRLVNFHFRLNGQSRGVPDIDRQTAFYFRKLRKHQVELISAISDDIEMIREIIRQSREIQETFGKHAEKLSQATTLMDVVRERITKRPTTLLQLEGRDKKIRELNTTFRDIRAYEDAREQEIRDKAETNPVGNAAAPYLELARSAYTDIEVRKERIRVSVRELKKGRKLLVRLATKGYSRFMKRNLEALIASHETRVRSFQEQIRQCRSAYCLPEPGCEA